MSNPAVLWIRRLEEGTTANVGTSAHLSERCQFLGYVVASSSSTSVEPCWFAVLHRFKLSGAYVGTDSWCADTTPTRDGHGRERAEERLGLWLGQLRYVSFQDIHIRPFSVTVDGHVFSLVREGSPRGGEAFRLKPVDLVFEAPWDGRARATDAAPVKKAPRKTAKKAASARPKRVPALRATA